MCLIIFVFIRSKILLYIFVLIRIVRDVHPTLSWVRLDSRILRIIWSYIRLLPDPVKNFIIRCAIDFEVRCHPFCSAANLMELPMAWLRAGGYDIPLDILTTWLKWSLTGCKTRSQSNLRFSWWSGLGSLGMPFPLSCL